VRLRGRLRRRRFGSVLLVPALVAATVLGLGCSSEPPRNLGDLVVRDSLYFEPGSEGPFTGEVVRYFQDEPEKVQLRGMLQDGTWNGELIVYHSNGRVRYQGALADGAPCGPWTENRDPDPPEDILAELKQEIEAMGLYPPCPEGR
jgi:hypothetical protein